MIEVVAIKFAYIHFLRVGEFATAKGNVFMDFVSVYSMLLCEGNVHDASENRTADAAFVARCDIDRRMMRQ